MDKNEEFDVVDDEDHVTGKCTRGQAHTVGHIHRSVLFFILDSRGNVFVNRRSASKEFYPGYWSIVMGGHVGSGEDYNQAVSREAAEEANVKSRKPDYIGTFKKRFDATDRENVQVYAFTLDADPHIDKTEVECGHFAAIEEIEKMIEQERFLPETAILLTMLKEKIRKYG